MLESRAVPPAETSVRIGALVPNSGPLPRAARAFRAMAARARGSRVRVALGQRPHRPSGRDRARITRSPRTAAPPGRPTTPYFDALIALALIAAGDRARDDRHGGARPAVADSPVVFAKQAASIDVASGGRLQPRRRRGLARARSSTPSTFRSRIAAAGSRNGSRSRAPAGRAAPAASTRALYDLPDGVLCLPTSRARRSRS